MITTYDLESFSTIAVDHGQAVNPVRDAGPCAELRVVQVAVAPAQQFSSTQAFSAVIAQQVLAQL